MRKRSDGRHSPPVQGGADWMIVCLAAASAIAAGCGPTEQRRLGPLRIAVASDATPLDPHLQYDVETQVIVANVYQGLTTFDAEMRVRGSLAESWENPTDLIWRLHLRDALLHDGRRLRAQHVKASLDRARQHPESKVAPLLVAVKEINVVDERTVEIVTLRPSALLLTKLASVAIVPADAPARITMPVGTGPYRFVSRTAGAPC